MFTLILIIEQATDGALPSENWALNMEICDIINSSTDGPKDAIKAIRKRLTTSAGKNYTVVMYTLTVLETCVKNCGKPFHVLVCNKEFISELVSYTILLCTTMFITKLRKYNRHIRFMWMCAIQLYTLPISVFLNFTHKSMYWKIWIA